MLEPIDIADLLVWAYRDQEIETNARADEDALSVHWAVLVLPILHGAMVRHFARTGHAPAWRSDAGTVVSISYARRARDTHRQWVQAMLLLRRALKGRLMHFRVGGPAASGRPWHHSRSA